MIKNIYTFILLFLLAVQSNSTEIIHQINMRIVDKPPYKPGTADRITKDGVTWYFDKAYPVGTFVNGDYWVAGDTVVIKDISPKFNGTQNGWEVNPVVLGPQGFSADLDDFAPSLVPKLPYKATPVSSIVQSVRSEKQRGLNNCLQCLKSAAVLTIVGSPISDTTLFRPPYVGNNKPFHSAKDLKTELLPNLDHVQNTPTIESFNEINHLQLDHKTGALGRAVHTIDGFSDDYGAYIGKRNADIVLRLMLKDSIENKMELLVPFVQYGIDLFYMIPLGYHYTEGGGHRPGQKLPPVFAAVMLDNDHMKSTLKESVNIFHERTLLTVNKHGQILYGNVPDNSFNFSMHEENYWKVVQTYLTTGDGAGYRSFSDPYGYIDGGAFPGSYYQFCCTSQPWKGSILALKLMPELNIVWNDTVTTKYVERWVSNGTIAQPDHCAPADSNWANYGITFGPNGDGGCILDTDSTDGIGRFPNDHNKFIDQGNYSSSFQRNLWINYYNSK